MNDEWTLERVQRYIDDQIEESNHLDYKGARALMKDSKKDEEVTKDVSSFANAAGRTIIYGVAEHKSHGLSHKPEHIDPIKRSDYSKERLEHIISTIDPRIGGVTIYPVTVSDVDNTCLYVVDIPQSDTVHQARDNKYYKRYNFEACPMQDYEVKDVINRARTPKLESKARIIQRQPWEESVFMIKLKNIGKRLAKDFIVRVELPIKLKNHSMVPEEPSHIENDDNGKSYWKFALGQNLTKTPLFPESEIILTKKLVYCDPPLHRNTKNLIESRDHLIYVVYADEMQPIRRDLNAGDIIKDWG